MLQAHPYGIVALVATAMCWGLAVVLFRVGTPGSVARKLALLLGISSFDAAALERDLHAGGTGRRAFVTR